ncbi:MAG TPA: carboxypeptidase-like regulatory domain-containing protein [Bryobacteraceae bacterium]|nr:carboxypeptidase-like regulatory domain-containing protein [Bryobacteraceae bacterium]
MFRFAFASALVSFLSAVSASGQTTYAGITGSVTDPNGAVVPRATVEAIHTQTNYKYSATSNEVGVYTLSQLREGEYTLRAKAPGFQEFVAQNIQLVSRDLRRIEVQLRVGSVDTVVEVKAGATLIETETARIGNTKGAETLQSLPLNTRSLYDFLGLTPGVIGAGGGQATRRFAGSRVNQSDQSIDGITVSNGYDGTQISPLVSYIGGFEEVRVDLANNTADMGSVGQVTVISSSGTNALHGMVVDYYSTPWFRARNPFSPARGTGVSHAPGGQVGGPVWIPKIYNGRNKSFFFFSFETSRGSAIEQLLNPTVPLPAWRAGDFSALAPRVVVRDPNSNAPFAGNLIPASRINPVAQKIQDRFFPLPNFGGTAELVSQNYRSQLTRPFDPNTYYTIRGDHRFSDKTFVFGRWTWNRSHSRAYEGNLPAIGRRWQTRDTRALATSVSHTLSPSLVIESRFGITYNDNPLNGPILGKQLVQDLGLVGLADNLPDINGLFDVSFSGVGITRITQSQWRHPGFKNYVQQYQQHANWFHGKHSLKGGFVLTRVRFEDNQASANLFGAVTFSDRFTGHPYGDFLLGIPTSASRAFPPVLISRLRWAQDWFVTDDYKITPSLTLNIGLRYEYHPGYSEALGQQAVFDVDTGKIVVPDGSLARVSPLLPRGYVDVVEAKTAGLPSQTLLRTDKNNFAPRFGLAWRPLGPNTVFRAGYGIFYDVVPRAVGAGGAPFVISEPAFTNPTTAPTVILPRVFPATASGPTTVGLPNGTRADLRDPFSMQYNVTIEHQRWDTGFRISYIGTNTRQGQYGYNINQPVVDGRAFIDKPRRFPNYPGITYVTNGAGHQYHSLTGEVTRKMARGLYYQLSWTWARDIGDLDRGASGEDAYDRRRERAVWLDIPTHRPSANVIYELPFGKGRPFLSGGGRALQALAGGWQVSGVFSAYTGQFLTPQWTGPDPTGTAFTSSRTPAQVTIRPNHLHDANLGSSERATNHWFDPTAFGPPAAGAFGSAAKGVIIGPGSNVWHLGIAKVFSIGERARLRWDVIAANAFNHPNYANPATNISSLAQVGVISDVAGDVAVLDQSGPRRFRMGLSLEW